MTSESLDLSKGKRSKKPILTCYRALALALASITGTLTKKLAPVGMNLLHTYIQSSMSGKENNKLREREGTQDEHCALAFLSLKTAHVNCVYLIYRVLVRTHR